MFRCDRDYGEMRTTHVPDRLSGAKDGDWDDARSIAGSILAHCDYEVHGDFVPDEIASIASDLLADRYYEWDEDIDEMLNWYAESFDARGEPIYDDDYDDGEDDIMCNHCGDNYSAWDCDYGECGACCDQSDCTRHGWE